MANEAVWVNASFLKRPDTYRLLQEFADIASSRSRLNLIPHEWPLSFKLDCAVGCQHWSRSFEWIWALVEANVSHRDVVLDAGGGDTELQFALARRADHVVNIDQDQSILDRAEMLARRTGVNNILFRHGDLTRIGYSDNHFDKIFCVSVVEHINQFQQLCLSELYRILKPGGVLFLTMDIAERLSIVSNYFVHRQRAQELLSGWKIEVPPEPSNILRGRFCDEGQPENFLTVLCARIEKPLTAST